MRYKATLHGGPHDGLEVELHWRGQPVFVLPHRLTMEQARQLQIDDVMAWKWPEDYYKKNSTGQFEFDRTVHYCPDHCS